MERQRDRRQKERETRGREAVRQRDREKINREAERWGDGGT